MTRISHESQAVKPIAANKFDNHKAGNDGKTERLRFFYLVEYVHEMNGHDVHGNGGRT